MTANPFRARNLEVAGAGTFGNTTANTFANSTGLWSANSSSHMFLRPDAIGTSNSQSIPAIYANNTLVASFAANARATFGNATANSYIGPGEMKVSNTMFVAGSNVGINNSAPVSTLQIDGNFTGKIIALGSGTNFTINCAAGNFFSLTANGATTINFTNAPANVAYSMGLLVTGGGSNTVTWANTPKWPLNTAPTLSTNTDFISLLTINGGSTWRGLQVMKDTR